MIIQPSFWRACFFVKNCWTYAIIRVSEDYIQKNKDVLEAEMNIDVVAVGKIKEKYLNEGIREYTKRLSRYCSLNIMEVDDEKAPENLSDKDIEMIKAKEGEKLMSKIPSGAFVVALAIEGKQLSSEALSEKISDIMVEGNSHIVFVIGGSLGLSSEILKRANLKLSFSKMTFPHQLMRMILLEQVYRAFRIMRNEPYHK